MIAYNDLMAIGFMQGVMAAGRTVPSDVSVIGFDNIVDATLVEPHLTTIAAPLVSLGSAAVAYLLRKRDRETAGRARALAGPARRPWVDRVPATGRPRPGRIWQLLATRWPNE